MGITEETIISVLEEHDIDCSYQKAREIFDEINKEFNEGISHTLTYADNREEAVILVRAELWEYIEENIAL